jgi:hypothetical protein
MKLKNIIKYNRVLGFGVAIILLLFAQGCKKFLQIPLPTNKISGSSAYTNDKSAAASINYILGNLALTGDFDGLSSMGYLTGLYADELKNYSISADIARYYQDAIALNGANSFWTNFYTHIYNCNLAIEGIRASTSTIENRNQWVGEALFLRAFLYFNLVNLYGDIPLTTSSDYRLNNRLARSPKAEVYKQIISDLTEAQTLLSAQYRNGSGAVATTDRTRPNKAAATALLARVYLYTGNWAKAEELSSVLINNTTDYALPVLEQSFLSTSKELIWGLAKESTATYIYVRDLTTYSFNVPAVIPAGKTISNYAAATMSNSLFSSFENGDQRITKWSYTTTNAALTPAVPEIFHLISKYKSSVNRAEDIVVLRLAEQYLIRAEARAKQNKLIGAGSAKEDLDAVRTRAGLSGTTASSATDLLAAIAKERRTELFSEMGHRFFDLKRTGAIDAVMAVEAPLKAGAWSAQRQVWPIPTADIIANPNLTQTPGY